MKKMFLLSAASLLLAACGNDGATEEATTAEEVDTVEEVANTTEEETSPNEDEGATEEADDQPEQQAGDVIEAEGGTRTVVATNYGIDEIQENGPFTITLKNAQLSQFQPAEDFVEMFGGEDLGMITFEIEVTNHSEETNSIYPDQGTAVTDTGQQIDAEVFLSDDVGGDFLGEVTKSGNVFFFFDGNAEDVSNVRYVIRSGSDENFESFGEDIEFSVDF